jgi:hypothetical protein
VPSLATLGRSFVVLFAVSTAFPIVAAVLPGDVAPPLMGALDVGLAALTVIVAVTLESRSRETVTEGDRAAAWRVTRLGTTSLLALLVVFFVAPSTFRWDILLVGLAWRAWLLIWVLPAVVAALRRSG